MKDKKVGKYVAGLISCLVGICAISFLGGITKGFSNWNYKTWFANDTKTNEVSENVDVDDELKESTNLEDGIYATAFIKDFSLITTTDNYLNPSHYFDMTKLYESEKHEHWAFFVNLNGSDKRFRKNLGIGFNGILVENKKVIRYSSLFTQGVYPYQTSSVTSSVFDYGDLSTMTWHLSGIYVDNIAFLNEDYFPPLDEVGADHCVTAYLDRDGKKVEVNDISPGVYRVRLYITIDQ